jgi:hypothetical protein
MQAYLFLHLQSTLPHRLLQLFLISQLPSLHSNLKTIDDETCGNSFVYFLSILHYNTIEE